MKLILCLLFCPFSVSLTVFKIVKRKGVSVPLSLHHAFIFKLMFVRCKICVTYLMKCAVYKISWFMFRRYIVHILTTYNYPSKVLLQRHSVSVNKAGQFIKKGHDHFLPLWFDLPARVISISLQCCKKDMHFIQYH
jgi:hypothetical protein